MKLSKLINQLQQAAEKYGDLDVGAYSRDYANDVDAYKDTHDIKFRVLLNDANCCLPGLSMDAEEEVEADKDASRFGVIFYLD